MTWLLQVQDKGPTDRSIAEIIIQRLESCNVVVPFAEIARSAKLAGRKELASLVSAKYNIQNVT